MNPKQNPVYTLAGDGNNIAMHVRHADSKYGWLLSRRQHWLILLAVLLTANIAWAQNKVLELDGNGSYVELPPNIFTNLTEATVEVWAKWDGLRGFSRIFEFGAGYQSMSLFNHGTSPDLRFNLYPYYARFDPSLLYIVRANSLIELHEWIHLAAVSGAGGMKLYANGVLVGDHTNAASFADIKVFQTNYFGRGLVGNSTDRDFRGQMDEIRVWNHRRSEEQIRENMFKRLGGTEEGLAGLWNFDDGAATDSSTNVHHGTLMGNAKVVAAELPKDFQVASTPSEQKTVRALSPIPSRTLVPANSVAVTIPANGWGAAAWWIAGALAGILGLLGWLVLMFRRSGVGASRLLAPAPAQALLTEGGGADPGADPAREELKQRALAELTEFAKESLVQGLYSQRKVLLEAQQKAQQELADLEARVGALHLSDRIHAYEKRIVELEKELESRGEEMRELTHTTLLLLRQKLEEEKERERKHSRYN